MSICGYPKSVSSKEIDDVVGSNNQQILFVCQLPLRNKLLRPMTEEIHLRGSTGLQLLPLPDIRREDDGMASTELLIMHQEEKEEDLVTNTGKLVILWRHLSQLNPTNKLGDEIINLWSNL